MILKVYDQKTEIVDPASLYMVSGSAGLYTINFEFSPEWDGYVKTVIFKRRFSEETQTILLTQPSVRVPAGIIKDPGEILIGIYGENGSSRRKPTLWSGPYNVFEGCKEGSPIPEPTPTMYEQILAAFGTILNLTATASPEEFTVAVERALDDGHYNFAFNFDLGGVIDCGTSTEVV